MMINALVRALKRILCRAWLQAVCQDNDKLWNEIKKPNTCINTLTRRLIRLTRFEIGVVVVMWSETDLFRTVSMEKPAVNLRAFGCNRRFTSTEPFR